MRRNKLKLLQVGEFIGVLATPIWTLKAVTVNNIEAVSQYIIIHLFKSVLLLVKQYAITVAICEYTNTQSYQNHYINFIYLPFLFTYVLIYLVFDVMPSILLVVL